MPSVSFLQKPASGGIRGWRVFILINRHMGNALLSGCCAFGLEHVALSSQGIAPQLFMRQCGREVAF